MITENTVKLEEYLSKWNHAPGVKPTNEPEFTTLFLTFLNDETTSVTPDGEGAYFGHNCIVSDERNERFGHGPVFEVAYSRDTISVYTGRHNGFWTPEYAVFKRNEHPEFYTIAYALHTRLTQSIGLGDLV